MSKKSKLSVCPNCGTDKYKVIGRRNWLTISLAIMFISTFFGVTYSNYAFMGLFLAGIMFIVTPMASNVALCDICKKTWHSKP